MNTRFTEKRWSGDGTGAHEALTTQCLTCGRVIARTVNDLYEQGWDRDTPPTVFAVELAVDLAAHLHAISHRHDKPTVEYVPAPTPF